MNLLSTYSIVITCTLYLQADYIRNRRACYKCVVTIMYVNCIYAHYMYNLLLSNSLLPSPASFLAVHPLETLCTNRITVQGPP